MLPAHAARVCTMSSVEMAEDRASPRSEDDLPEVLRVLVARQKHWSTVPVAERIRHLKEIRNRIIPLCVHWGRAIADIQRVPAEVRRGLGLG